VKIHPTTRPKNYKMKKIEIKDETLKGTIEITLWGKKAEYIEEFDAKDKLFVEIIGGQIKEF